MFDDAPARLSEFLDAAGTDHILAQMGDKNTLVIITEDAFAGHPYTLTSNDTLAYLGPTVVDG